MAATDLQQIERPFASDISAKLQESRVAEEDTIDNLSKENLVLCGCPAVFTPSFLGASLVEGRRGVGWGVHRKEQGQGEGETEVERGEAGLSTSHRRMKRETICAHFPYQDLPLHNRNRTIDQGSPRPYMVISFSTPMHPGED